MRKLILFILPLLLIFAGQHALALRIGDIDVYSALNQPLEAEITLVSDKPGETEGILVALASDSAFEQAGVPRLYHLSQLKFQLGNKPDGTQIIKVTTRDPVREPFLDFLLDIDWPSGRTVKKFTILLDPPVYASKSKAKTKAPESVLSPGTDSGDGLLVDETPSTVGEPSLIQRDKTGTSDGSVFSSDPDIFQDEPLADEALDFSADAEEVVDFAEPSAEDAVDDFVLDENTVSDDLALQESSGVDTFGEDLSDLADDESLAELEGSVFNDDVDDAGDAESYLDEETLLDESLADEAVLLDAGSDDETGFDEFVSEDMTDSAMESGFSGFVSSEYPIPDIDIVLDESIPYDIETTQTLLAEFAEADGQRVVQEGDYEVAGGDYLHKIASSYAPEGVSINQAMLAILRHNPEAFIRDNINNIKKGAVLRIPDQQEMLILNDAEALSEVQRQNGLWREYKRQLAGTASSAENFDSDYSDGTSTRYTDTGSGTATQLSIVAPGKDDDGSQRVSGQQDGVTDGTTADTNLLLAQEALEAERLEKLELQDRLKDLEEQVSMMQRLITLKDQQYAELQAQLAGGETPVTTSSEDDDLLLDNTLASGEGLELSGVDQSDPVDTDPVTEAVDDGELVGSEIGEDTDTAVADGATDSLDNSLQDRLDSSLSVADPLVDSDTADETTADADSSSSELDDPLALDDAVSEDASAVEESNALEDESETQSVEPPVTKEETYISLLSGFLPRPYNAMLEDFLSQPYGLPVLLVLPLLIIVGVFLLVRKLSKGGSKEKSIFLHEPPQDEHDAVLDDELVAVEDPPLEPSGDAPAEPEFNPERTQTINEAVQEAAQETQSRPAETAAESSEEDEPMDDTTAEADVYLAYGLFDQAEDLLKQALANNPDRHEYRGKLLETYFAEGKRQEFEALAAELKAALGNAGGRLWEKAVAMGKEIAPDSDLFSGTAGSGLKASDFAPAKPEAADIELGGDATMTTDVDLAVGGAEVETDFDLGIDDAQEHLADTVISPADTVSADEEAAAISEIDTELEFDLSEEGDLAGEDLDADLDLDFNADDLGLSEEEAAIASEEDAETILEAPALDELDEPEFVSEPEAEPEPEPVATGKAQPEETVALDMDLNLDELDLGDIADTDDTDFDLDDFADVVESNTTGSSAADELLAEIDDADLDLTMPGEDAEAGEDTIIEDEDESDETIITADIDFDETFTGDSDDDDISLDEVNTKLDLARAYIDMGDNDGASSTLNEVIAEGSDKQRKEAKSLLAQIG